MSSMQSGVYWGYVGLIGGLIQRIKAEYGKPMTVVATGGLAHLFHPDIPAIDHVDPDFDDQRPYPHLRAQRVQTRALDTGDFSTTWTTN